MAYRDAWVMCRVWGEKLDWRLGKKASSRVRDPGGSINGRHCGKNDVHIVINSLVIC